MFKVNSKADRLDYGALLTPPDGYTLYTAVGTTYSLDLETLTAVAISLGLAKETDSELRNNPIAMLNALQKVSDRILIFADAGQIKLPSSQSPLFLLLEKMVVSVVLPFDKELKGYPSFHPKMWLLVFQNKEGERRYRLAILSRNLTFDRSWDVSVALNGEKTEEEVKSSLPLQNFLRYLRTRIKTSFDGAAGKRARIEKLAEEIAKVRFSTDDRRFSDFQILPLGIGENRYDMTRDSLWKGTFHELLILSPFLSAGVIRHFNEEKMGLSNCRRTLITRRAELDKLTGGCADRFAVYVLKDEICDGEDSLSENTDEAQRQDIHAKLYIRRKISDVDLYLGSMNASHAAVNHNVELMLRLRTKNRYLNTDRFLNDLFGDESQQSPFEAADLNRTTSSGETDETGQLERQIRRLCASGGKAEAFETGDTYQIRLHFPDKDWTYSMTLAPFRSGKSAPVQKEIVFEDLDALQVSAFYRLSVAGAETELVRIIMIPTANLPRDSDARVVQSIVKDRKSFMNYVMFVLEDDPLLSTLTRREHPGAEKKPGEQQAFPAVYEKMLKAAAEAPEKLEEINRLLTLITDERIIPREFRETWRKFQRTCRLK